MSQFSSSLVLGTLWALTTALEVSLGAGFV
jgi:hypothetical protein